MTKSKRDESWLTVKSFHANNYFYNNYIIYGEIKNGSDKKDISKGLFLTFKTTNQSGSTHRWQKHMVKCIIQ